MGRHAHHHLGTMLILKGLCLQQAGSLIQRKHHSCFATKTRYRGIHRRCTCSQANANARRNPSRHANAPASDELGPARALRRCALLDAHLSIRDLYTTCSWPCLMVAPRYALRATELLILGYIQSRREVSFRTSCNFAQSTTTRSRL